MWKNDLLLPISPSQIFQGLCKWSNPFCSSMVAKEIVTCLGGWKFQSHTKTSSCRGLEVELVTFTFVLEGQRIPAPPGQNSVMGPFHTSWASFYIWQFTSVVYNMCNNILGKLLCWVLWDIPENHGTLIENLLNSQLVAMPGRTWVRCGFAIGIWTCTDLWYSTVTCWICVNFWW